MSTSTSTLWDVSPLEVSATSMVVHYCVSMASKPTGRFACIFFVRAGVLQFSMMVVRARQVQAFLGEQAGLCALPRHPFSSNSTASFAHLQEIPDMAPVETTPATWVTKGWSSRGLTVAVEGLADVHPAGPGAASCDGRTGGSGRPGCSRTGGR